MPDRDDDARRLRLGERLFNRDRERAVEEALIRRLSRQSPQDGPVGDAGPSDDAAAAMDEAQRDWLRERLLSYRGITEANVEECLPAYADRERMKHMLVTERGHSNVLAETFLDREGYSRPPGWHPVFFYPGSNRLRGTFVFWGLVAIVVIWLMI